MTERLEEDIETSLGRLTADQFRDHAVAACLRSEQMGHPEQAIAAALRALTYAVLATGKADE